jgi:hypothetical protein
MSAPTTSPPPPPRELNAAAASRAWRDPRVAFWGFVAVLLIAAAAYLAVGQYWSWSYEAKLIKSGSRVDATVWHVGTQMRNRLIQVNEPVQIIFHWKGEERRITDRGLAGVRPGMTTGSTIPIMVDPNDPRRYTARLEPQSLATLLIGPMILLPVALLLLAVSFLQHRSVLRILRHGQALQASVIDTARSALAPRSQLIRCALLGVNDRRVISVYVPNRAGALQPGDALWLIMPPGKPHKALAAAAFA